MSPARCSVDERVRTASTSIPAASNRPERLREDPEAGRHELDDAQPGHAGSSIGMTSVSPLPTATTSSSQVIRTR